VDKAIIAVHRSGFKAFFGHKPFQGGSVATGTNPFPAKRPGFFQGKVKKSGEIFVYPAAYVFLKAIPRGIEGIVQIKKDIFDGFCRKHNDVYH
jgi:hypothetical protein